MQILIVEDEKKIADILKKGLAVQHYKTDVAFDGEEALKRAEVNTYDFILLDLMIPKIDGIHLCRLLRAKGIQTPVLILTAKDSTEDIIAGLDAGADDYVTKPFAIDEISARIRALLRRNTKVDATTLTVDDVTLNPAARIVKRNNQEIPLTAREYALLEYFMRNTNTILSQGTLLDRVWGYEYEGFSNIVETYVKYLRKKLRAYPKAKELIHTVRGLGYKMEG